MPEPAESPTSLALRSAMAHFRAGRMREAKAGLEKILRSHPHDARATHVLGLIAHAEGEPALALELLQKAVKIDNGVPFLHGNLAEVYRSLGSFEEAVSSCQKALDLNPKNPEVLNTLGAALYEQGDIAGAETQLRRAVELEPEMVIAHGNLGNVLRAGGRLAEAVEVYERTIRLAPRMVDAYLALGSALRAIARPEEAVDCFRTAVTANPTSAECWFNLGASLRAIGNVHEALDCFQRAVALRPDMAGAEVSLGRALRDLDDLDGALAAFERALNIQPGLADGHFETGIVFQEQGKWTAAEASYRKALALNAGFHEAQNYLGTTLLAQARYEDGQAAFWQAMEMRHGTVVKHMSSVRQSASRIGEGDTHLPRVTRFLILDRLQQLEHLLDAGRIEQSFRELADCYRSVLDELDVSEALEKRTLLNKDQAERIGPFLNKIIHYEDAAPLAGPAVNQGLEFRKIEGAYFSSDYPAVYFDDFLTQDALRELRRFCQESTIYFHSDPSKFVASRMSDGFNCSLMYQISEELKSGFARVLGTHHLSNMWSYRHAAVGQGVAAHTDFAAVTFNFWITPDTANLDPDCGGLAIYSNEQPLDWNWMATNTEKNLPEVRDRIQRHLANARQMVVPYRENRAVMFHSNLFHHSDRFCFADSFHSRRINISLVFGHHARSNYRFAIEPA